MTFLDICLSSSTVNGDVEQGETSPKDDQEGEEEGDARVGGTQEALSIKMLGDESSRNVLSLWRQGLTVITISSLHGRDVKLNSIT